ncbi:MAG TPA: hypothetical protein VE869_16095 [Gemmatimonas sp.]|nr:hypothetical protein [Gemmatimonas sp.]
MHQQSSRQLQECTTSLPVADVLSAAARFFTRGNGVYSAFVEKQGPTHIAMRGQGGEELVIAARTTEAGTVVSGSTYLFDAQIARFLDSLPRTPAQAPATQVVPEPGALPEGAADTVRMSRSQPTTPAPSPAAS